MNALSAHTIAPTLLLALFSGRATGQAAEFAEKLVARMPAGIELEGPAYRDPNGREYKPRSRVVFSPDGRTVAYVGYKAGRSHAVLGGVVSDGYDFLSPPVFSANGEHVVFRAGNRVGPTVEMWWLLRDGKPGKAYSWIGEPAINDNGDVAFWEQPGARVQRGGEYNRSSQVFHFGKRKGRKWEDAQSLAVPALSADGRTVATVGMKGGRWFAVTVDRRGERTASKGFGMITAFAMAPDAKRVALVVSEASGKPTPGGIPFGKQVVIVDGKRHGGNHAGSGNPVFAPRGKRFAFAFTAASKGKMGVAVDTETRAQGRWDLVHHAVFSPDGKRLAYVGVDGCELAPIYRLTPHGWRQARGGKAVVVTRSVKRAKEDKSAEFDAVRHLVFGPSGKAIAFAISRKGKWHVVCGKKEGPAVDEVGLVRFSADGNKVAYGARLGRELWWKVLELR